MVAMAAKAANKFSRREVARQSQALWDGGFGLGLRLFKVKLGSLGMYRDSLFLFV